MLTASNAVGTGASVLDLHVSGAAGSRHGGSGGRSGPACPASNVSDIPVNTPASFTSAAGHTGRRHRLRGELWRAHSRLPHRAGDAATTISGLRPATRLSSGFPTTASRSTKLRRAYVLPTPTPRRRPPTARPRANGTCNRTSNPRGWRWWPASAITWRSCTRPAMGAQDNCAVGWLQDPTGTNNTPSGVVPGYVLTPYYTPPPSGCFRDPLRGQHAARQRRQQRGWLGHPAIERRRIRRPSSSSASAASPRTVTGEHIDSDPYSAARARSCSILSRPRRSPTAATSGPSRAMGSLGRRGHPRNINEGKAYITILSVNYPDRGDHRPLRAGRRDSVVHAAPAAAGLDRRPRQPQRGGAVPHPGDLRAQPERRGHRAVHGLRGMDRQPVQPAALASSAAGAGQREHRTRRFLIRAHRRSTTGGSSPSRRPTSCASAWRSP